MSTQARQTNIGARGLSRTWALLGARAGDNDQVIALAEALGSPFQIKSLEYNLLHAMGPRVLQSSLASLTRASRDLLLHEPPPDITISTGHRSVPVVRALRRRSRGRTRSIHIGFPRISPAEFDLVVATPQYPIAEHPNVLRIPFALTRAATEPPDEVTHPLLDPMVAPRQLLIIGGPTLYWDLDAKVIVRTLSAMLEEARAQGGSVLVATSPRTPNSLRDVISGLLGRSGTECLLVEPGAVPPYQSLLRAADSIRVTADSVSMVSDAIWAAKPLALVPVAKSPAGRAAFAMNDAVRPGRRIYPQDLRAFWNALTEIGISDTPALPRTCPTAIRDAVVARARHAIHLA